MAPNQKVEENRPPLKFDWLINVYNLYTPVYTYTMYTMQLSGIISSNVLSHHNRGGGQQRLWQQGPLMFFFLI